MPKKIRILRRMLLDAGFAERSGKGSHRNYKHPLYRGVVTLPGKPGDDADRYLEKLVERAVRIVSR